MAYIYSDQQLFIDEIAWIYFLLLLIVGNIKGFYLLSQNIERRINWLKSNLEIPYKLEYGFINFLLTNTSSNLLVKLKHIEKLNNIIILAIFLILSCYCLVEVFIRFVEF